MAAETKISLKKTGQHRAGEPVPKKEKLTVQLFTGLDTEWLQKHCAMDQFESQEEYEEAVEQNMVDFAEPFAVEEVSWLDKPMEDGQALKRKMAYFQSSFAQASTVQQSGRGQYMIRDEPEMRENLLKYVPTVARYTPCEADVPTAVTEAAAKDSLLSKLGVGSIAAFGLAPGKQHLGTEYGESGSVRTLCDGVRLAGSVNICDALAFMQEEKAPMTGKGGVATMPDMQSFPDELVCRAV